MPYRNFAGEKSVLEDLEVFLHGAARNLRVGSDGLVVYLLTAGEGGDFKEAAERRKVSRCALLHDLLFKIERDVSGEVFLRIVGKPDTWHKADVDGSVKVEGGAEFGSGERM